MYNEKKLGHVPRLTPAKKNILVFLQKRSFLGAQIVHMPFFHFLREQYPRHRIIAVSPKYNSVKFLLELGYVDETVLYHAKSGNVSHYLRTIKQLRSYDPVLAFQLRRSSFRTTSMMWSCNATTKVGFKGLLSRYYLDEEYVYSQRYYGADAYLKLLDSRDATLAKFAETNDRQTGNYVLLMPAGTDAYKLYAVDKYIELARSLKSHCEVHFLPGWETPGPEMNKIASALLSEQSDFTIHLNTSTSELRDLVLGAKLVIANDCGPSHFAHIYDVPRIVLFADYYYPFHGQNVTKDYFLQTENSRVIVSEDGDINSIDPAYIADQACELLRVDQPGDLNEPLSSNTWLDRDTG